MKMESVGLMIKTTGSWLLCLWLLGGIVYAGEKTNVIIIVDIDYFSCPSCAENFVRFCDAVKTDGEKSDICIVVSNRSWTGNDQENPRHLDIVKRQWVGFYRANAILWPYVFDVENVYRCMLQSEATILIHNKDKNVVKKYCFPLSKKEVNEIKNYL
jgi:hypothetical protein